MKRYLATLLFAAASFHFAWAQPAPAGATETTTIASRDPFADDLATAEHVDLEWRSAKNRLEDLGGGCAQDGDQIINTARSTKQKSILAYTSYYQKSVDFWRKIRDTSGGAEISGRAEAAELHAHAEQLERELSFTSNRRAELDRALELSHVKGDRKALDDLTDIEARKRDQVEQARAAIEQNELARGYILKRRDYARQRMDETQELLQGLRTETFLYEQLYNAVFHRYHLGCDQDLPHARRYASDWRDDVERLSEKKQDKQDKQ